MGTTVDPNLLVADDIMAPPAWDRDKELEFRTWAVAELTKRPFHITFADPDQDQFNVRAMEGLASFNKGVVTVSALEQYFRTEHEQMVTKRPLWKELGKALSDMNDATNEAKIIHWNWLEKNKETNWFIVWTSETLGEGSTDLPEQNAFAESDGMQAKCLELLAAQKLELLAPFIEATAQKLYKVIGDVEAYDKRVTTGAQTAIKWAERFKTAGSIAAGIASGGLGLTGSALVAGGYSFAQGAAEQMSAVGHGLQDKVDWSGLATSAGVTTLLAVAGGALQQRFAAAWEPRLASFGPTLGKRMSSVAAAGTSQFYLTGAELAIGHFVQGHPLPASVDDLADLIITKSLEGAGMDIATHAAGERAASEYQAWKAKRAGEVGVEAGIVAHRQEDGAGGDAEGRRPEDDGRAGRRSEDRGSGNGEDRARGQPGRYAGFRREVAVANGRRLGAAARRAAGRHGSWARHERSGAPAADHALRCAPPGVGARGCEGLRRRGHGRRQGSVGGQAERQRCSRQRGEGAPVPRRTPPWLGERGRVDRGATPTRIEDPNAVKAQKALERELSPEVKSLGTAMGRRYADFPGHPAGASRYPGGHRERRRPGVGRAAHPDRAERQRAALQRRLVDDRSAGGLRHAGPPDPARSSPRSATRSPTRRVTPDRCSRRCGSRRMPKRRTWLGSFRPDVAQRARALGRRATRPLGRSTRRPWTMRMRVPITRACGEADTRTARRCWRPAAISMRRGTPSGRRWRRNRRLPRTSPSSAASPITPSIAEWRGG